MYRLITNTLIVLLAISVTIPLVAQEKKKRKKRGQQAQPVRSVLKRLKKVELTKQQSEQIEKLAAEYGPKIKAAQDKLGDGNRKLREARKKASAEGKKGRQLAAAINAALTPEQRAARKERQQVSQQFRAAIAKILTEEQREKAGLRLRGAGAKKKNKKRKRKNKNDG